MIDNHTWDMILGKSGRLPGALAPEIIALAKEKGYEFTDEDPQKNYPDQLDEYRKEMTENGWDFGQDDEELFELAMHDRQYRDYKSGIAKKRFEDDLQRAKDAALAKQGFSEEEVKRMKRAKAEPVTAMEKGQIIWEIDVESPSMPPEVGHKYDPAPSTNPAETLICNTIGMLAAGNAVFFSVHPGAKHLSRLLVSELNQIIAKSIGIENLIVTLREPSIESAQEMMLHPDVSLLVVTGGPGVVKQALQSGKKVIGAGAGNPPAFVDETADIKKAAQDIVLGASLDNNILCIAEKSVVAMRQIEPQLVQEMVKVGCVLIDNQQDIQRLVDLTVLPNGTPNKKFVGKNASVILDAAHIPYNGDPRLIIMRTPKNHPFAVIEMLMPILPVVTVDSFDEGIDVCLMLEAGLHHTATMHSLNMERLNRMARKMKTSIFVKNGPSYAGLGFSGEGTTTFTIATPTGESTTSARCFARRRRCCLTTGFNIR